MMTNRTLTDEQIRTAFNKCVRQYWWRSILANVLMGCVLVCVCLLVALVIVALGGAIDHQLDRVAPADPPCKPITVQEVEAAYTAPEPPTITMEATAYTYECGNGDGLTATGTPIRPGVVSVDPAMIPLGTELWVEGYGPGRAEDTGGAIKGHRVDLFFETEAEAWEWGRRRVEVRVVGD